MKALEDEMISSSMLFPKETEGPRKGKIRSLKDSRGNVIVDPFTVIEKKGVSVDFETYFKMMNGEPVYAPNVPPEKF